MIGRLRKSPELITRYRSPVYQGVSEDDAEDLPQRRPLAKSIKNRFANIVSMYVPNGISVSNNHVFQTKGSQLRTDLVEDFDIGNMNDHFGLLSLGDLEGQSSEQKSDLCTITPELDKATLFPLIINSLEDSSYGLEEPEKFITCMAADEYYLYVGVHSLPFLFKIKRPPLESNPSTQNITKIPLKLSDFLDFTPSTICLKIAQGQTDEIYVIGTASSSQNLLACYSADGKLLAQTRKYDYPRYLAVDVDSDGNPILACASTEGRAAEICKLTPRFERRIFSITLSRGDTSYRPEWIAKSCAGGLCWASVSRHDQTSNQTTRRILAFPGVQPNAGEGSVTSRSPKEWLQVMSWNFDSFKSGTIAALDPERLLSLDVERRSLALITWPEGQSSVSLQRITKPGSRTIDAFCAAPGIHGTSPYAFFSSEGDIFKFVPLSPALTSVVEELAEEE